jgi:Fe-S-cluster containining protein
MEILPTACRTAFSATERLLRSAFAEAELNVSSFTRRLAPCSLTRCGGTCCAEGASLNAEEALVLQQITRKHRPFFLQLITDFPEHPVVHEDEIHRTAVKPRSFREQVADYPEHFPETACTFLLEDGRCALQCKAEADGKHPWTYKPLACWLHPISLSGDRIELVDEQTDPHPGGFGSQTHCGRTSLCGSAAHEVLAAELSFLGAILERDLLAELRGQDPA